VGEEQEGVNRLYELTMSDLRRRIFGFGVNSPDSTPASSRDASPAPTQQDENTANSYTVVPVAKLDKLSRKGKKQATKRRNMWIFFVLGGLLGVLVAGFFATSNGGLDKLADMAGLSDMNLDAILDVLPAGLIQEVRDLQVSIYRAILLFHKLIVDQGDYNCRHQRKMSSTTTLSRLAFRLGRRVCPPGIR